MSRCVLAIITEIRVISVLSINPSKRVFFRSICHPSPYVGFEKTAKLVGPGEVYGFCCRGRWWGPGAFIDCQFLSWTWTAHPSQVHNHTYTHSQCATYGQERHIHARKRARTHARTRRTRRTHAGAFSVILRPQYLCVVRWDKIQMNACIKYWCMRM